MAKALELDQISLVSGFMKEETERAIYDHTSREDNPHNVDAEQVGLGNVDNTSDLNKPISKATQSALNSKTDVNVFNAHKNDTTKHITIQERELWNAASSNVDNAYTQIGDINSKISALNTALSEIREQSQGSASAVQDNLTEHIEDTVAHITATERQLWNNASDTANTAYEQGTALSESVADIENKIKTLSGQAGSAQGSADQVQSNLTEHINDKTNPHQVSKAQVGLGNVDNTSDADKPVSAAQQAALDKKANTSHGTHVTFSSTAPGMDGMASVGSASTVARSDHTHPTDTSRAAASHTHSASDITSGTLDPARLPIIPISKSGTGATTATAALANLGAFPSSGGTISGAVNINGVLDVKNNTMHIGTGNSGAKINFGDGDYVHIYENPDDDLEIKADNINFVVKENITLNGKSFGGGGVTSADLALKADKDSPVFTGSISMGRKSGTTVGENSVAMGYEVTASEAYSCAEGVRTQASGIYCHAEGIDSTASGQSSHAEGMATRAYGDNSHAEGNWTQASALDAHAEGYSTTASEVYSHAEGHGTKANAFESHAEGFYTIAYNVASHAGGHYNKTSTTYGSETNTVGDAMVIGNGTSTSSRSNCFRVTYSGSVYGKSSYNSSGADYAEYFEWSDGNPDNEDRVGYFVTLDEDKIRIASLGDYILGIVSGQPCIIGNADEDWLGRWEHDNFGRFVLEYLEEEKIEISTEEMSEDEINTLRIEPDVREEDGKFYRITTVVVDHETPSWRYKANPDYDASQPYIERKDRKEWDAVGMMGVLSVWDDGTCQVNGFCSVAENGTATAAEKYIPGQTYRVIKRVTENVIKVVFR